MRDYKKFTSKTIIDAFIACGWDPQARDILESIPTKDYLIYGILDEPQDFQDRLWKELTK